MTVDDSQAENLATKATAASHLTSSTNSDIQTLYAQSLQRRTQLERDQDSKYLSLAPTFLSLHQQASSSKQLLTSLETFLSTFQSDLSTLSTHISALQTTSNQIDSRLDATRDVEVQLASFLSEIALSPRVVDLFFETEPEGRPELWGKAVKQLEKVLEATSPSASLPLPDGALGNVGDIQAVKEVRSVAESCKNIVASKLRTFLTSPHSAIKASVTTNLQVLQTSILLRHHRPLYAFLARQMPRVAIDVQRSYVAAARLYFETAFRRYARSLGVVRKRWVEPGASSSSLITDPAPSGGKYAEKSIERLQSGMAGLSKASSGERSNFFPPSRPAAGESTPTSKTQDITGDAESMSAIDAWAFTSSRLQYSRLDSPAATVLGYLADDSSYRVCPENLFRSLSLVLIDNACSEYTFLVRFFEGEEEVPAPSAKEVAGDDSVSMVGEDDDSGPEASVIQLSTAEQAKLKPRRGATNEIFKQIFEPAISTYTSFGKAILTPTASAASSLAATATGASATPSTGPGGYFSLLSMLQLNDSLLGLLSARGCSNAVVEGALMGFKISAYPLVKRFLDDQISALSSISNPSTTSGGAGIWGAIGSLTGTSPSSIHLTEPLGEAMAIRYASLFTKTLWILQDTPDQGILSALSRLRSELAKVITTTKATQQWTQAAKVKTVKTLIGAIEATVSVPNSGLSSHEKVQNEFSFWNEQLHNLPS